jgi:Lon protease-like protein
MVGDSLEGDHLIGLIQPRSGSISSDLDDPPLYSVGCVGRIEQCEEQTDGRYHLLLKGASRFRVLEELPLHRGYRRVKASYEEYREDGDELSAVLSTEDLLTGVREFCSRYDLAFDIDLLSSLDAVILVNGLCAALPFDPAEKQALLESNSLVDRAELLLQMLGFAQGEATMQTPFTPPTVH